MATHFSKSPPDSELASSRATLLSGRVNTPVTTKRVAIVQSNYIPWKGYFDLIDSVDEFILLDTVQFTRRDWRNRNTIKTAQGLKWLTIPVVSKGKYHQRICDTQIADSDWAQRHWQVIRSVYRSAPCFNVVGPAIEELYRTAPARFLSEVNRHFLDGLCRLLSITTALQNACDFPASDEKSERLVDLCLQTRATEYVSGPAARDYLETNLFTDRGVSVSWFQYDGYVEYPQQHPPFVHHVSVLDLLFQTGDSASCYIQRDGAGA